MVDPATYPRGTVVWTDFSPTRGREQSGHRPAVVVSSLAYQEVVATLLIVVPCTSVDRGWPNHVPLTGDIPAGPTSFALTEQVRTVSHDRVTGIMGRVDHPTLRTIDTYLADFLDFPA